MEEANLETQVALGNTTNKMDLEALVVLVVLVKVNRMPLDPFTSNKKGKDKKQRN